MRKFSKQEQKYLKYIVNSYISEDWNDMILNNLIFKIFQREISFKEFPAFELKSGESADSREKMEFKKAMLDGYIPIANFISLIDYLNMIHLISIVPYFEVKDFFVDTIGSDDKEVVEGNDKRWFPISDHSYVTFLRINYPYFIYPTQEIIDLVESDFITSEDKKYKTQVVISTAGIIIALLLGLGSIYYSFINSQKPIDINSKQLESLIKSTISIDKDLKLIEKKDSLGLKLVLKHIKKYNTSNK